MSGYLILVVEQHSDHEVELCHVGSNPAGIVAALKKKTLNIVMGGGKKKQSTIPKYVSVRAVER